MWTNPNPTICFPFILVTQLTSKTFFLLFYSLSVKNNNNGCNARCKLESVHMSVNVRAPMKRLGCCLRNQLHVDRQQRGRLLVLKWEYKRYGWEKIDRRRLNKWNYGTDKPLNIPAQIWHLNVSTQHKSTGQIQVVFGVGSDQLMILTECIWEHLIQPTKHSTAFT